jgi:uncharacterized membrane protein
MPWFVTLNFVSEAVPVLDKNKRLAYWRANLRLMGLCLTIWFLCSFVFGILLVEQLNAIRIGPAGIDIHLRTADFFLCMAHESH